MPRPISHLSDSSPSPPPTQTRTPLSVSPSSSTASLPFTSIRPRPLKIVLIGPASVGKTSLRQAWFEGGRFKQNYKATIGADFEAKVVTTKRRSYDVKGKGKAKEESRNDGRTLGVEGERKVLVTVWDVSRLSQHPVRVTLSSHLNHLPPHYPIDGWSRTISSSRICLLSRS